MLKPDLGLHDATLVSVEIAWAKSEVALTLDRVGTGRATLVFRDFRHFECPRRQPWGPSVSVNGASQSVNASGEIETRIEMQSGDVLRIVARVVDLSEEPRREVPQLD